MTVRGWRRTPLSSVRVKATSRCRQADDRVQVGIFSISIEWKWKSCDLRELYGESVRETKYTSMIHSTISIERGSGFIQIDNVSCGCSVCSHLDVSLLPLASLSFVCQVGDEGRPRHFSRIVGLYRSIPLFNRGSRLFHLPPTT